MDVKIYELREEPENIELLLDIISIIFEEAESIVEEGKTIKDFDLVNYVLANALKADKIDPSDLGLVLSYLSAVNAPSIFFQYAILRVHQNLSKVKLIDISLTLTALHHLADEEKISKLLNRVENHIETTNEIMLAGDTYNLKGL